MGLPVHLHTHDTSGVAATLLEATRAGVDVDAALAPLSGLTAQPNLNSLVAVLKGTDWDPRLDEDGLQHLANYWEAVREYAPFESGLKSGTEVYRHEIPGGQYSNYRPQVAGLGLDKWEECKDMYRKVNLPRRRREGDAVVEGGRRHGHVPREERPRAGGASSEEARDPRVGRWASRGMLGQLHGGFPEKLRKVILKDQEPITCRPGELLEPADLEAERKKASDRRLRGRQGARVVAPLPERLPGAGPPPRRVLRHLVRPDAGLPLRARAGQETTIEIEPGKTLIVRLVNVGKLEKDGTRDLHFELNGERRAITVRDQAAAHGPSRA